MDITLTTPALFFPAISLIMLAYTNRFLALASIVRNLHSQYKEGTIKEIEGQIRNLKYRLRLIKNMQAFGIVSFLFCIFTMCCIYIHLFQTAEIMFGLAMLSFVISLIISLIEIQLSTKALELSLGDMHNIEDPPIVNYFKRKPDSNK